MSLFWEHVGQLNEAANAGFAVNESTTVLIGADGGIQILANNDWPLDRIAQERGARQAYRVTRHDGRVTVNGIEGNTRCTVQSENPALTARRLLR